MAQVERRDEGRQEKRLARCGREDKKSITVGMATVRFCEEKMAWEAMGGKSIRLKRDARLYCEKVNATMNRLTHGH